MLALLHGEGDDVDDDDWADFFERGLCVVDLILFNAYKQS